MLSENLGAVVRTGKQLVVSDICLFTQMSRVHTWDQWGLVQMIQQRRFSLIVLSDLPTKPAVERSPIFNDRWTTEQLQAITENYEFWQQVGKWYLLRPRGETPAAPKSHRKEPEIISYQLPQIAPTIPCPWSKRAVRTNPRAIADVYGPPVHFEAHLSS